MWKYVLGVNFNMWVRGKFSMWVHFFSLLNNFRLFLYQWLRTFCFALMIMWVLLCISDLYIMICTSDYVGSVLHQWSVHYAMHVWLCGFCFASVLCTLCYALCDYVSSVLHQWYVRYAMHLWLCGFYFASVICTLCFALVIMWVLFCISDMYIMLCTCDYVGSALHQWFVRSVVLHAELQEP